MNFGGKSKPKGSLGLVVTRANPRPLIERLKYALKGALDRWH